ncbi:hypothetical protein AWB74_04554 [Caballeronia arvi]|uniref:Transposase n=1 Tax=Caballeronia arvi TaxID=1777135 RepID=A0A158K068_9BURK|nr:hypothetical protein AWB74_04554 [Caballeronia arvi]
MMRQPIGTRIELRIRERLIFEDQRDGIGCTLSLLLEQLMNAQIVRIGRSRIVPRAHQQVARLVRQYVESIHWRLRCVFERLRKARKRLLHIAAQLLG